MAAQAPTDFPIPEDVTGFWQWDKLHAPRPLPPLDQELITSTGEGFTRSMLEMGSTYGVVTRFINYYGFLTMVPQDLGGEDRDARLARYDRNVADLMPRIGEKWDNEWLPKMLPDLEKARTTDWSKLSEDELVRSLGEMRARVVDRWAVHGLINYSFYAAGLFADFYRDELQPENEKEGYEVLQGFPSIALDSARGLWQLSRKVRENAELRELFDNNQVEQLKAKLPASETGRAFLRDLDAYLQDFGWRADSVYELNRPAWREDPSIPLGAIQGYLTIGDEGGPDAQYQQAVDRREQLLANARAKLAGKPDKLSEFNRLYAQAERFTPISEDHNHYIDQMGDIQLRYPALEIGRRLVARGLLEKPEDIFFVYFRELRGSIEGADRRQAVAERKQEWEKFSRVVPPPIIGVPPPFSGDPVEELLMRFFGTPVEPSSDPAVINGIAASPGTAHGRAKVVRDLTEASKVSQGDVLVCEMTLPPWTPLFSTVSAVVADTGGVLSHCAIVAREYRIPCVVGTAVGTAVLKDGMMLTVDGTRGLVRIES
jgi:rifampicin phosphotransferase